jgi:hypothetical protein
MNTIITALLRFLGRPRLVEFDYRDRLGLHHGRCYVSCLCGDSTLIKRMTSSFGYTNIHIA